MCVLATTILTLAEIRTVNLPTLSVSKVVSDDVFFKSLLSKEF